MPGTGRAMFPEERGSGGEAAGKRRQKKPRHCVIPGKLGCVAKILRPLQGTSGQQMWEQSRVQECKQDMAMEGPACQGGRPCNTEVGPDSLQRLLETTKGEEKSRERELRTYRES